MLNIISWIIFGLIAGLIARALMPGRDPGGFFVTVILGIAGAIVGGFIARALNIGGASRGLGDTGFLTQLFISVVGAIILLAVYRLIAGRRA